MSTFLNIKNRLVKSLKANRLTLLGIGLGGIVGYLYWHFVGCKSGTCAISSKPINSSIYGMIMGGLLLSSFKSKQPN